MSAGSPNVVVRFPRPLLARLDRAAAELERPRSELIREVVQLALENFERPTAPPLPPRKQAKRKRRR